jgi:outer membrane immunogenic protein
MRHLLLASVAATALTAGSAFAADLPKRTSAPTFTAPAPLAMSWSGFYVGVQAGGAWDNVSQTSFAAPALAGAGTGIADISGSGILAGGHAGYNMQFGQVVVGLEGDVEFSNLRGSTVYAAGTRRYAETNRESIRARLGYAADKALFYVTGGVAFTNGNLRNTNALTANSYSVSRTGWTLGAGIEYAIDKNWSARAEYRYSDFGRQSISAFNANDPFVGTSLKSHITDSAVRLGVSYRFGGPAGGAVVAKY